MLLLVTYMSHVILKLRTQPRVCMSVSLVQLLKNIDVQVPARVPDCLGGSWTSVLLKASLVTLNASRFGNRRTKVTHIRRCFALLFLFSLCLSPICPCIPPNYKSSASQVAVVPKNLTQTPSSLIFLIDISYARGPSLVNP